VQPKKFAPFEASITMDRIIIFEDDEVANHHDLVEGLRHEVSAHLERAIIEEVNKFYGPKGLVRMNEED
jgi:hypothetical protein